MDERVDPAASDHWGSDDFRPIKWPASYLTGAQQVPRLVRFNSQEVDGYGQQPDEKSDQNTEKKTGRFGRTSYIDIYAHGWALLKFRLPSMGLTRYAAGSAAGLGQEFERWDGS